MDREITRSTLRRAIFAVRMGKKDILDRDQREIADEVEREFSGYLLGAIGWADFSIKWDIHPEKHFTNEKLTIAQWGEYIISYFEWKEWLSSWTKAKQSEGIKSPIPPPCFSRQEG